jgi:hypothetical protein
VLRRTPLPAWAMAAGVAVVFCGLVGYAKASHHWKTLVPDHIYRVLVPSADEVSHPMPGDEALK